MKLIVAVDENWAIGSRGELLERISADLKRFKTLTTGHTVILGRKTLQTFPGGRPLPNRRNIILSRDPDFVCPGAEVCRTAEEAAEKAGEDAFVIGGESVYRALLPMCSEAFVTKIRSPHPADAWFPNLDSDPAWAVVGTGQEQEEKGVRFCYVNYRRREKK